MKSLESNIWKYGALLVTNKRMFVPILGAYYLTIDGITAASIGTILLIGSLAGFIFEIPSGYLSDKIGHKQAIIVSRLFLILSTTLFLFADQLVWLILGAVTLELGNAFMSGTGSAFMHETLKALGKDDDYTRIIGKLSALGFAIPIALTVVIPFLVTISFKLPFLVALVIDSIGLVIALLLVAPKVPQEHIDEISNTNFKQVIREGTRLGFMPFALFSGTLMGFLMAINIFRAPFQVELGIPVIWFGVLHGIGRTGASLMLAYSGSIRNILPEKNFYLFQIILYTTLMLLLGIVTNLWVLAAIFIIMNAFQWGLSQVGTGYRLKRIKDSKFKATLLSIPAQIDALVSAVIGFAFGYAVTTFNYHTAYLLLTVAFICTILPIYVNVRKQLQKE